MAITDNLKISKSYLKILCHNAFTEGVQQARDHYRGYGPKLDYYNTKVRKAVKQLRTPQEKLTTLLNPNSEPKITINHRGAAKWTTLPVHNMYK